MTSARDLAQRDPVRWAAATRHPFLDGARDGTLPIGAFERWLQQDQLFVENLARAWAKLFVSAPTDDLGLLASGIASFVDELSWFPHVGARIVPEVPAAPLPATAGYNRDLMAVAEEPYPVAIAAMWAVEAAYLEAWRSALPGHEMFRSFAEHWTAEPFAEFVERLERAADAALASASPAEITAAGAAVAMILEHEASFWAMTWTGR